MLNAAVMPTTQKTVKPMSRITPASAGNELREKLRPDSGRNQQKRRDGHAHEKLDLVMQQAAVVEEPVPRDQCAAGDDAGHLHRGYAVQGSAAPPERIQDKWRCRPAAGWA